MERNKLRNIVGAAVILAMYHLIIFVVPFTKGLVFYLTYGFTLVAFGLSGLAVYHALKNPNVKSKFYGFPVARVGLIYLAVQLVLGLVFMAVAPWVYWWIPVLCYGLVLLTGVLSLISTEVTSAEILHQDEQLKKNVTVMRGLQSKVLQLAAQCDDPMLKKLAEEIRYSDPVGCEAIVDAEADLAVAVDQLRQAVKARDTRSVDRLSRKALNLLAERNRLCKLNK